MWLLRRAFESSSLVMSARHSSRLKCVCELCSFIQAHSCRPLVRLSFSITCVYRHKIRKRKAALFPLRLACGGVFALSCCCPAAARSCRRLVSSSNYKPSRPRRPMLLAVAGGWVRPRQCKAAILRNSTDRKARPGPATELRLLLALRHFAMSVLRCLLFIGRVYKHDAYIYEMRTGTCHEKSTGTRQRGPVCLKTYRFATRTRTR